MNLKKLLNKLFLKTKDNTKPSYEELVLQALKNSSFTRPDPGSEAWYEMLLDGNYCMYSVSKNTSVSIDYYSNKEQ